MCEYLGGDIFMELDSGTISIVLAVLLGLSEALGAIPSVKANSVYQLILNILTALTSKKSG